MATSVPEVVARTGRTARRIGRFLIVATLFLGAWLRDRLACPNKGYAAGIRPIYDLST